VKYNHPRNAKKNLSAKEDTKKAGTWVLGAHGDEGWSSRVEAEAEERAEAAHGVKWGEKSD